MGNGELKLSRVVKITQTTPDDSCDRESMRLQHALRNNGALWALKWCTHHCASMSNDVQPGPGAGWNPPGCSGWTFSFLSNIVHVDPTLHSRPRMLKGRTSERSTRRVSALKISSHESRGKNGKYHGIFEKKNKTEREKISLPWDFVILSRRKSSSQRFWFSALYIWISTDLCRDNI